MLFKKKRKILLKKFIRLRKNVQNRAKILKFKKKKWQKLVSYLHLIKNTNEYKIFDHNRHLFLQYGDTLKKNFKIDLETKQRFNYFYGTLNKTFVKKLIKKIKKYKIFLNSYFINCLESRIDTILYRCHFTLSIKTARQLISHGCVLINKKKVTKNSFLLKKGDILEIKQSFQKIVVNNIKNTRNWLIPPKYLQINYKILQIVLIENPLFANFSTQFPFWLDTNTIIQYYKYH